MNRYKGSDGQLYSQSKIDRNRSKAYKEKHECNGRSLCAGCEAELAVHNDHTIAQARCKVIGKTELIWDKDNFEGSCAKCHQEWEAVKGLEWMNHRNIERRLKFMRKHDPEGYAIRMHLGQ